MKEKENINMLEESHITKELKMSESESFHMCGAHIHYIPHPTLIRT